MNTLKIDVYDFDKTLYKKDSTLEFWKFCIYKKVYLIFLLPYQFLYFILNKIGIVSTRKFKQEFFIFLRWISYFEIERLVEKFWIQEIKNLNEELVQRLGKNNRKVVCISASPEFLINYPCKKVGIDTIIATNYDLKDYLIVGENCKGIEKVKKLNKLFENYKIENFYSDSLSDLPLFDIAENGYLVKNKQILKLKRMK